MLSHLGGYVGHMLRICWLSEAYVGVCWPQVGLCWPYVEPSWRLCWAYVGDLLAILGLCWGHVRRFMLKKSSDTTLYDFFPSRKAKTMKKPRFFDIAKLKFSAAKGPETL